MTGESSQDGQTFQRPLLMQNPDACRIEVIRLNDFWNALPLWFVCGILCESPHVSCLIVAIVMRFNVLEY
jgi:hypothetical protein